MEALEKNQSETAESGEPKRLEQKLADPRP